MEEIKAPNKIPIVYFRYYIFLAGSIEMGSAENWQSRIVNELKDYEDVFLLNPRRDGWDSSWTQSINNPKFVEQVTWELDALERSNLIIMYFDPNTKSPITLLELGLHAMGHKLIVCCPEGFWRKGNVDIVCKRYGVRQAETFEELVMLTKERLNQFQQKY